MYTNRPVPTRGGHALRGYVLPIIVINGDAITLIESCDHLSAVDPGTIAFREENGFVLPSLKAKGKLPLYASTFVADYLRPAAIAAGVKIEKGQRFGCTISAITQQLADEQGEGRA
jgi:hypothetical protein